MAYEDKATAKKFEGPVTAVVSTGKRSFIFGATWHVVLKAQRP